MYFAFHRIQQRVQAAPTIEIQVALQNAVVAWLMRNEEKQAAGWYEQYWTGQHGNYTYASAGYVGSHVNMGMESAWRYLRRDTVGNAGTNMNVSLKVFSPSLCTYVTNLSQRHAEDILCVQSGRHIFPSIPTISPAMWKAVQEMDVRRILLCYVEQSAAARQIWLRVADGISDMGDMHTPVTEKIRMWHEQGGTVELRRTLTVGFIMPTDELIRHLERKGYKQLLELQRAIEPIREQYDLLFNDTKHYMEENPITDPDKILNVMEAFNRYESPPPPPSSCLTLMLCVYAGLCRCQSRSVLWALSAPAVIASPAICALKT